MSFTDVIKKSVIESFSYADISTSRIGYTYLGWYSTHNMNSGADPTTGILRSTLVYGVGENKIVPLNGNIVTSDRNGIQKKLIFKNKE